MLTATASSDLAVDLEVTSGPALMTGDTLSITGAGTVTVRASQPGTRDLEVIAATADFVVTEIRLDPVVPAVGSTFTAYVSVKNIGSKAASGGSLSIWLNHAADGTVAPGADKSATVGTVKPGLTVISKLTGLKADAAQAGHTFRAFVDAKAQVPEVLETNNQQTLLWHPGLPDFVVADIAFSPDPPPAGGTFTATVTVRNEGESAGDAGSVEVWAHAATAPLPSPALRGTKSAAAGTLLPGHERILTFTALKADTAAAPQTFCAVADGRAKTVESNDANNVSSKPYQVGRPDFVVTKIEFSANPVTCGKAFTACVTVSNQGNATGDAGYLDVWLDRAGAPPAGPTTRAARPAKATRPTTTARRSTPAPRRPEVCAPMVIDQLSLRRPPARSALE